MAPEVIDLTSSSPPPQVRPAEKPVGLVDAPAKSPGQQNRATNFLSNDFVFLSDDFDDTIDLGESVLAETTKNKRRLSQHDVSRPAKRSSLGLPKVQPGEGSRSAGPFQLWSSPSSENSFPLPEPKQNDKPVPELVDSNPFTSSLTSQHSPPQPTRPPESSDPFADSPHIRFPKDTPKEKRPESRPNPFARSSRSTNGPADSITIPQSSDLPANSGPTNLPQPPLEPEAGLFVSSPITSEDAFHATAKAPSLDPFASSPGPTITTAEPKPTRFVSPEETAVPSGRSRRDNDWDPISSSGPNSRSLVSPPRKKPVVIEIEDSDLEDSEDELPDISTFVFTKKRRSPPRSQSQVTAPKNNKTKPRKTTAELARERDAKAAAKELNMAKKRTEKQEAQKAKAREKERATALAEVNKLRTDKKVSTPEMIVDIPSGLNPTIHTQLAAMLEGLDVQFTTWESPVENVVKWRRKVKSRYDTDLGRWEPVPLHLEDEKYALVVLTAEGFVKLVLEDELEAHASKMMEHFDNHQIIYLLEGLMPWMRKNRNIRNRQFTSHVRSQEAPSQAARRRPNATPNYVPEETIEDALLQLQVMHDVLIHHTTVPMDTSHWISTFTQHISTVPYRKQRDEATLGAGFCMESGQVKTGDDARETYIQMLQEIVRVTQPIAYGITAEFSSVGQLVRALETDGSGRLEGVRKHANKDGAYSDRTVGQAVSRRIYKVFTGRDQASTDI